MGLPVFFAKNQRMLNCSLPPGIWRDRLLPKPDKQLTTPNKEKITLTAGGSTYAAGTWPLLSLESHSSVSIGVMADQSSSNEIKNSVFMNTVLSSLVGIIAMGLTLFLILNLLRSYDELRAKQRQLIQSGKLAALGELSAGIAHEINQPLTALSMGLENIAYDALTETVSPQTVNQKCASLLAHTERIKKIIAHVRIFSREQDHDLKERFDINECIDYALSLMTVQCHSHGIRVRREMKSGLPPVLGNRYLFEQVIQNILSNARYALDRVDAARRPADYIKTITIATNQTGRMLRVEIEDNGIGILPRKLDRIFDPFYTTKPPQDGTGLGLSIAYGLVQDMNGSIQAESRLNEFTRLCLLIPSAPENRQ